MPHVLVKVLLRVLDRLIRTPLAEVLLSYLNKLHFDPQVALDESVSEVIGVGSERDGELAVEPIVLVKVGHEGHQLAKRVDGELMLGKGFDGLGQLLEVWALFLLPIF